MPHVQPIALSCKISQGGFSGEKVVHVVTAEGKERLALAPTDYCWTKDRSPLPPNEPSAGQTIEGFVAAIRMDRPKAGRVVVSTPDGDVFAVLESIITERPKPEPIPNVPVTDQGRGTEGPGEGEVIDSQEIRPTVFIHRIQGAT